MNPLRKTIFSFAIVSLFGIVSTWLSSCANSEAAGETGTDTHVFLSQTLSDHNLLVTGNQDTSILKIVQRLESRLGQPELNGNPDSGSGLTKSVDKLATLTSKLSDDIGKMADRIVETEKLIVAVTANQTQAAQAVISDAKDLTGAPLVPALTNVPVNEIPMVLGEILASLQGAGTSSVLLNLPANLVNVSPVVPPEIIYNAPVINRYQLLVSDNPRFSSGIVQSVVDTNANPGAAESLASVWQDAVIAFGGVPVGGQLVLYIAVQDIDSQNNNQLSRASNSIKVPVNP